jgi:hypothetical protein
MNRPVLSRAKIKNKKGMEGRATSANLMIHRTPTGVLGCPPVSLQEQCSVIISFESLRKKKVDKEGKNELIMIKKETRFRV